MTTQAAQQVTTVGALAVIVREAAKRNLPSVSWQVDGLGSTLVGNADELVARYDEAGKWVPGGDYPATRSARRAAFDGYTDLLRWYAAQSIRRFGAGHGEHPTELKLWPEHTGVDGRVVLMAVLKHVTCSLGGDRRAWLLTVAVRADLEPDPED